MMKKYIVSALLTATAAVATAADASTVTKTFGPSYTHSTGGSVNFQLTGLDSNISGDLVINFTTIGDFDWSGENYNLFVDGQYLGTGCDNNTSNGNFGGTGDVCSQASNTFFNGSVSIAQSTAAGMLSDNTLNIRFAANRHVHAFVDVTTPHTANGVTFTPTYNFSMGAGGTVTYNTVTAAPVPLPAAGVLLAGALGGLRLVRKRKTA